MAIPHWFNRKDMQAYNRFDRDVVDIGALIASKSLGPRPGRVFLGLLGRSIRANAIQTPPPLNARLLARAEIASSSSWRRQVFTDGRWARSSTYLEMMSLH